MADKYAFYELKKVPGENKYIPKKKREVYNSLAATHRTLDNYWEDRFDYPGWYNPKTGEEEWHEKDGNLIYVPNYKLVEDEDGAMIPKLVGAYGRREIYYIDVYPHPYSYYKLRKKGESMYVEGVIE